MPLSENRVVIACAGSGKTTRLVNESLASRDRRIAIVTYTNNNIREIVKRFGELNSGVPGHVDVMTWFGFLLREWRGHISGRNMLRNGLSRYCL